MPIDANRPKRHDARPQGGRRTARIAPASGRCWSTIQGLKYREAAEVIVRSRGNGQEPVARGDSET